jgi:hypothetical protein
VVSIDAPPRLVPNIDDDGETIDDEPGSTARLQVIEHWKGETDAEVSVAFEPNMFCPAPPRYDAGATVLAFLVRDIDGWQTAHLSYGTLYPSPEDLPIYAARVREALTLQSREQLDRADRIEWLVRCAEHRATRWDGLYELVGSPKPPAYEEGELRIPPAELLTDGHRARIALGFLRDSRLDGTLPLLIDVLGPYRDDRFDRAVIAAIDEEFDSDNSELYVLDAAIPAILSRLGVPNADSRIPSRGDDWRSKSHRDALRKAWVEAKATLAAAQP